MLPFVHNTIQHSQFSTWKTHYLKIQNACITIFLPQNSYLCGSPAKAYIHFGHNDMNFCITRSQRNWRKTTYNTVCSSILEAVAKITGSIGLVIPTNHCMFQFNEYFVYFNILNAWSCLYFNYFNVFLNINFQHIKIQHIYTTIPQRNLYILTVWLSYTSSVYESGNLAYVVYFWFDSLIMVPCGFKYAGMFSVIYIMSKE